jgi:hypothetical protein
MVAVVEWLLTFYSRLINEQLCLPYAEASTDNLIYASRLCVGFTKANNIQIHRANRLVSDSQNMVWIRQRGLSAGLHHFPTSVHKQSIKGSQHCSGIQISNALKLLHFSLKFCSFSDFVLYNLYADKAIASFLCLFFVFNFQLQ